MEITDLIKDYLKEDKLYVQLLGRGGFAWLDTGTYDGLANATDFVRTIQKKNRLKHSLFGRNCLQKEMDYYRSVD